MSSKKKPAEEKGPPAPDTPAPRKLYHAMRNGTLYRSIDGVNWEIETDPDAPVLPEGASRVTRSAKGRS